MCFFQQGFQLGHNVGFQHVFNGIGVSVNLTGSDVRMSNQVQLPKSMLACQSGGFFDSLFRQPKLLARLLEEPRPLGTSDFPLQTPRRPTSLGQQIADGNSTTAHLFSSILTTCKTPRGLEYLKHGAQQVLAFDRTV